MQIVTNIEFEIKTINKHSADSPFHSTILINSIFDPLVLLQKKTFTIKIQQSRLTERSTFQFSMNVGVSPLIFKL